MEISIFAKRRQSKDGKTFFQYITTLTRKDGTTETMRVCFRDVNAPKPESCPRNIVITKAHSNVAVRKYNDEKIGEVKESKTLWVNLWEDGTPYVDHSMDDYDID